MAEENRQGSLAPVNYPSLLLKHWNEAGELRVKNPGAYVQKMETLVMYLTDDLREDLAERAIEHADEIDTNINIEDSGDPTIDNSEYIQRVLMNRENSRISRQMADFIFFEFANVLKKNMMLPVDTPKSRGYSFRPGKKG